MDTITIQSKGGNFVEARDEFVPDKAERTRTIFKAAMRSGGIRRDIIRHRKNPDGTCEELILVNFGSLHLDDGMKIALSTDTIQALFGKLKELEVILRKRGVHYGTHDSIITDTSTLVINNKNKVTIIRRLLEVDLGEKVWNQLTQNNPDITIRLVTAKLHEDRITLLYTFEQMPSDEKLTEND